MSPKFKFRYDTVLKHRKNLEQKEAKEFAKLHKKYDEECERLDSLFAQYEKSQKELDVKKRNGIDIKELETYYTYLNALNVDINAQKFNIKAVEAKMETQRKKLIEAQKKKKVMDKLKEHRYQDFKEEERKSEINAIDEINTNVTARKPKYK